MKGISKASVVLALVCGIWSSQGWALPASQWQPGRAPVLNLYYGGSSATDRYFDVLFMGSDGGIPSEVGICQPGTIDIYRVDTTRRVIFCNARAGIRRDPWLPEDVPAGTPIAFHQSTLSGSSGGLIAVARSQHLAFFNMGLAPFNCANPVAFAAAGGLNAYTIWTCGDTAVAQIPDVSVSDTEAATSAAGLSPAEIAELYQSPGVGSVFSVPVTLNLYRALQIREGRVPDDNKANVPSLTSSEIREFYSRQFTDWSSITDALGTPLPLVPGVTPPWNAAMFSDDSSVFICRGVNSARVQAAAEIHWFQQRCPSGPPDLTFALADHAGPAPNPDWLWGGGGFVHESPSVAQIRSCLNAHHANGTWAIGTLSTETTLADLDSGNFRMIRVDGALPNLAAVANGDYDFFIENVLARRQVAPTPPAPALPLIQYIEMKFASPAATSAINVGHRARPWGDGGLLSIPTFRNPPSTAPQVDGSNAAGQMRAYPVNSRYRSVGGVVDNCSPPAVFP